MSPLVDHPSVGFRFLPGIAPYSAGVVAVPGNEIVHVTLAKALPWHAGLGAARRYLESLELRQQTLCGVELRCPAPHSLGGFSNFNREYRQLLEEWGMLVTDQNPVARTNVAPVNSPPDETMLHAFSYVEPSEDSPLTFVVAGGGELPHRELERQHIVRVGETSSDAIQEKAECVLRIMQHRLDKLGGDNNSLTAIDVYTAHPLHPVLENVVLSQLEAAKRLGVHWYYSRPPINEIEFEMDMRGVRRELTIELHPSPSVM